MPDTTTNNRNYKDSVFVDLFSEDEKAAENFFSLYNALHETQLNHIAALTCTLLNAVWMPIVSSSYIKYQFLRQVLRAASPKRFF